MAGNTKPYPITIDLNQFKLHIELKNRIEVTLHFNSPSRRFYLSVIALVVNEMKRLGKITSIPLEGHHDLLALLNETIGGSAGSSEIETLLSRIYMKWQHALPNLEEAPLFTVLGKKKGYEEGVGKTYHFTEAEKDHWANLFEYKGSHENVRLKFAIDRIGATLNDIVIIYEDSLDGDAWEKFISGLKEKEGGKQKVEPDALVSEEPEVPVPQLKNRSLLLPGRYRRPALIGAILGIAAIAIWGLYIHYTPQSERTLQEEVASKEKMAFPLPELPSVAVLPFVNMSEDPKQEFLSDGITENIITSLSKVRNLFVISRHSTFSYKGKPVKVKQVSEELGVQYVLEGSVQRLADRIRINAQLIDVLTGRHIWTERYDRDLTDLFALQDEITMKILMAIQVKLTEGEQGSGYGKFSGKASLDCYLKIMEGFHYGQGLSIEATRAERRIAEEVMAMCPEAPGAYYLMGLVHYAEYWLGIGKSPQESIEKGIEMGQKTIAMDDSIAGGHTLLCSLYGLRRDYDKAIAEGERAVALNPGGSYYLECYANVLTWAGRSEEAIPILEKAVRFDPVGSTFTYLIFGSAFRSLGKFEEAASAYKKALQRSPNNILAHLGLAFAYSMMGKEQEARAEAAEVLRLNPKFSVDNYARTLPYKDQAEIDRYIEALRKAGLK